jgi:hypothetical protein
MDSSTRYSLPQPETSAPAVADSVTCDQPKKFIIDNVDPSSEVGNAIAGCAKTDNSQGGKAEVGEIKVLITICFQPRRRIVVGNATGGDAEAIGSKGGDASVQKVDYIEGQSLKTEGGKVRKGDATGGEDLGRQGVARGGDSKNAYPEGRRSY